MSEKNGKRERKISTLEDMDLVLRLQALDAEEALIVSRHQAIQTERAHLRARLDLPARVPVRYNVETRTYSWEESG